MRRIVATVLFIFVAWVVQLLAAQSLISNQDVSCVGNDVVCTFPSATTSGNAVIAMAWVASTETITINNSTFTFTATNNSPFAPTNQTARMYIWCGIADGDSSYTFTTSGTGNAGVKMGEFADTSCTADAVGTGEGTSTTPQVTLETTVANTVIVILGKNFSANRTWTPSTGFTLFAGGSGLTTLNGEYGVVTSSGSRTPGFTLNESGTWALIGAAYPSAGGAAATGIKKGSLSLMGVGR
jgi:hypothetical protein